MVRIEKADFGGLCLAGRQYFVLICRSQNQGYA